MNKKALQKVKEAQQILSAMGLPTPQQNEMSAFTLLALAGIKPNMDWSETNRHSLTVSKGVMTFTKDIYGREYAPNTRETFRRQVLHQFVQAGLADYNPDSPNLPTNSPKAHYALSEEATNLLKAFATQKWEKELILFKQKHGDLTSIYRKERVQKIIPVKLSNGKELLLSPGEHNIVQAEVIEKFAPRFASGSSVLYIGDTANKNLYVDTKVLSKIGVPIGKHEKLPDIVLYDSNKKWLFLVEVVTSHGPMNPKRIFELEEMLENCKLAKVFITAFPDLTEFKHHSSEIAWETEVWIADIPDHMIHFNGDRFVGPYKKS